MTIHQLFIDIKKVKTEILLYTIPVEFTVPTKLVRLIKMCIFETHSKVFVGKLFSDMFLIQNGFEKGDALSPLRFSFTLEFSIRKLQEKHAGLKPNWIHWLLFHADGVNLLGEYIQHIKGSTELH